MSKIEVKLNPDVQPSGSDLAIVNAARRSFNTRSEWEIVGYKDEVLEGSRTIVSHPIKKLKDKDKRLIEFLARGMTADDFEEFTFEVQRLGYNAFNQQGTEFEGFDLDILKEELWQWRNTPTHDTPFNHTFISFEVKAPIFCRAQLVKHEYLIMSEFSRRYITDNIEFYEPDSWRGKPENKKQGSADWSVPYDTYVPSVQIGYDSWEGPEYADFNVVVKDLYEEFLSYNLSPEQVRMLLPQSTMTEWTWSGTLGAFAKMCTLRLHPEAQYEARLVAQEVYKYLKEYYPVAAPALVEGVK